MLEVVFDAEKCANHDDSDLTGSFVKPSNEKHCLRILRQCRLVENTLYSESLDRYVALCSRYFKVPTAIISLINSDHMWMLARVGFPQSVLRKGTICSHTLLLDDPDSKILVLRDTLLDPLFKSHAPNVRFYVGASIIVEGVKLGTLCICDTIPHVHFSKDDEQTMLDICETISSMISERRRYCLEEQYNGVMMHQNILTLLKSPLTHLQRSFLHLEGLAQQSLVSNITPQLLTSFVAVNEEMHNLSEFLKNLLTTIPQLESSLQDILQQVQPVVMRCEVVDFIRLLQQSAGNLLTVRSHVNCRALDIPFADVPLLCFHSLIKALLSSYIGDAYSDVGEGEEGGSVDVMITDDNSYLIIHCCFPPHFTSDLRLLIESPLYLTVSNLLQMIHGLIGIQGDEQAMIISLPCCESTAMITRSHTPLLSNKSGIYCHHGISREYSQEETDRSLTMSVSNDYTDRPRKSSLVPPPAAAAATNDHHPITEMVVADESDGASGLWKSVISPIAARLLNLGSGGTKIYP
jgi:hypothetical protein